jgi:SSS family solute:Na+ symporter
MGVISNIIVSIAYLIAACYFAYKTRKKSRTPSDYVIAGRETPSGVMALSHGATVFGTAAIIGFGGMAALFGFSLLWLSFLCIVVGIFIAFVFCGKRTRRIGAALNAHTFPEVLGERYQSRFIQGFAGMVVFAFIPLYAAAALIGIARTIEVSLHVPYVIGLAAFSLFLILYVILSGLQRVIYMDTYHGVFMFIVMVVFCYWTYQSLGGIIPAHQALMEIASLVPAPLADGGHQGWTAGLVAGHSFWWIAYSSIIYGVGIGTLCQPQLVIRFLRTPSDRELNRGVLVGGVFMLAIIGIPLIVGPLTNVIFVRRLGQISIAVAEGNIDKIIPVYVNTIMPAWFGVLFLVGMLAASTVAISSQFRIGGTSLGRDFYAKAMRFRRAGEIFTTQLGIALTVIATILWGFVLPPSIIAVVIAFFFGLCAASFLPSYLLGLYWKGVTRTGAVVSMVGGFCVSFIWIIFFHYLGSAAFGICEALFGRMNLVANALPESWIWQLQYVDPAFIALPIAFGLCIVVSHNSRKMPKDHINRCFRYITS